MKRTLLLTATVAMMLLASGCATDPENPPKFRVRNDYTTKANLQVKTTGGSTININDVQPGQTTDYRESSVGRVDLTVSIQGISPDPQGSFNAETNGSYTVRIANTSPPVVVVTSP